MSAAALLMLAMDFASLEKAILTETNKLRADPKSYAAEVKEWKTHLSGKQLTFGDMRTPTKEGAVPIDETIAKLQAAGQLKQLTLADGLIKAARDHATDQGQSGGTGHIGKDGSKPSKRMAKYGKVKNTRENISYGPYLNFPNPARALIIQLLVDDGVADRGHRKTLLMPELAVTGVACGKHPKLTLMCVMTYAQEIK